jgi:hypothetical protein
MDFMAQCTVWARSSGSDGESVGFPVTIHASGSDPLRFMLGTVIIGMHASFRRMAHYPVD